VFFLPQLDFVQAWYFTSDGVVGSTVTTDLVDLNGRNLPLDDQAYMLKKHPYLPRYDNPGLAQLIRSKKLIKLTYAQQGKILLQWINLNLTIVQVTGLGVGLRAGILGMEELGATAYEVAAGATRLLAISSATRHLSKRDVSGVALDVTFFVIPQVVNAKFIDGIEVLSQRERYILKSLNDLQFSIVDEATTTLREGKR
jgi:hypothetical protein